MWADAQRLLSLSGIIVSIALLSFATGCTQERVTAQPTSIPNPALSRINLAALSNDKEDPRKLCNRISELKLIPFHSDSRGQDPLYDEIMNARDAVVPCLIERVTDTKVMTDPRETTKRNGTTVGDVAFFLLVEIGFDIRSFLPQEVQKEYDVMGIDSFTAYAQKPEHRKELQEKLLDWYHRAYRPDAQLRAQRAVAPDELRNVKIGGNDSDRARLDEKDGRCTFVYRRAYGNPREGSVTLDLSSPCEFVRDKTGAVEIFNYLEDNKNIPFWVVMVVGGPLDTSRSDQYMRAGCGTYVQAIRITDEGKPTDITSGAIGTGITVCPSEGVREKVYRVLAKRQ